MRMLRLHASLTLEERWTKRESRILVKAGWTSLSYGPIDKVGKAARGTRRVWNEKGVQERHFLVKEMGMV